MQKMHIAGSDKPVVFYNLDVIISVGYRVNSLHGTQFRIWATNVLRQHLVQGYTVHAQRLKDLNQAVRLVADVAHRRTLSGDEATALLEVVADYAYALAGREERADAGRGEPDQPAERVAKRDAGCPAIAHAGGADRNGRADRRMAFCRRWTAG